ncbi:MAG: SIS domain-containing protein [Patescibacteria group bacterium]
MTKDYFQEYFEGAKEIINRLDKKEIKKTLDELIKLKKRKGRLFLLGVGGSAANCSHAVNDFRKICGIESYAPTDNVGELTARTNDDGWETVFVNWLKGSQLTKKDAIIIFSVGGGNLEKNISANIVSALVYAKKINATILGIVSRDGGYTKKVATSCILIPVLDKDLITPYAEAFQAVVWHALVFHPKLREIKPY